MRVHTRTWKRLMKKFFLFDLVSGWTDIEASRGMSAQEFFDQFGTKVKRFGVGGSLFHSSKYCFNMERRIVGIVNFIEKYL